MDNKPINYNYSANNKGFPQIPTIHDQSQYPVSSNQPIFNGDKTTLDNENKNQSSDISNKFPKKQAFAKLFENENSRPEGSSRRNPFSSSIRQENTNFPIDHNSVNLLSKSIGDQNKSQIQRPEQFRGNIDTNNEEEESAFTLKKNLTPTNKSFQGSFSQNNTSEHVSGSFIQGNHSKLPNKNTYAHSGLITSEPHSSIGNNFHNKPTYLPDNPQNPFLSQMPGFKGENQTRPDLNTSFTSSRSQLSSNRTPKPIVVMNIHVGNGRKEEVHVYEGNDPFEVASSFCIKHSLPTNIVPILANNIRGQVNNYYMLKTQKVKTSGLLQNNSVSVLESSPKENANFPTDVDPRLSEKVFNNQPQPHTYSSNPALEDSLAKFGYSSPDKIPKPTPYETSPIFGKALEAQQQNRNQTPKGLENSFENGIKDNSGLAPEDLAAMEALNNEINKLQKKKELYAEKFRKLGLDEVSQKPQTKLSSKAPGYETFGGNELLPIKPSSTRNANEKPNIHERLYAEARTKQCTSKSPVRGGRADLSNLSTDNMKNPMTERQPRRDNKSYSQIHQEKEIRKKSANEKRDPTPQKSDKRSKSPLSKSPGPQGNRKAHSQNSIDKDEGSKSKKPNRNDERQSKNPSSFASQKPSSVKSEFQSTRTSTESIEDHELRLKVLREIFNTLDDDDMDGKISIDHINISYLSSDMIDSLSEILSAIEVNHKKLLEAFKKNYGSRAGSFPNDDATSPPRGKQQNMYPTNDNYFYSPKGSATSKDSPSTAYDSKIDDDKNFVAPTTKNVANVNFEAFAATEGLTNRYRQIVEKNFAKKK